MNMKVEESTPIPDAGVTPDNVLSMIDGVADGLLFDEEEKGRKEEPPAAQDTEQDSDQDSDQDTEQDQDADQDTDLDSEQDTDEDTGQDEDSEPTASDWEELTLKGANNTDVPFALKVEDDGTRVYRFQAADQKVEVDEAEMIAGYQRQQDYNRKVNEVVREKDNLLPYANVVAYLQKDPTFVQHIQSYFQNGAEAVRNDAAITDAQIKEAMEDDPDEARQLFDRREAARQRAQHDEAAQAQQAAILSEWAQRQKGIVMERYPNYDTEKDDIREFLISEIGFSEQEVLNQYDSRLFTLAHMAWEKTMDENQRRAPRQELKDKRRQPTPPRIIKAGAGKQSKTTPQQQKRAKQQKGLFAKAMESQNSDDWTAAIETLLPDDL